MKIPTVPPSLDDHLKTLGETERHQYLIDTFMGKKKVTDTKGRYLHWDKLQYLPLPEGINSTLEYWHRTKAARDAASKSTVFGDKNNVPFQYVEFDKLNELKDWVLENAAGVIDAPEQVKNSNTQATFLISGLIEEAISSSQMEGASTTRRVAKDMLRSGREPRDVSEQMIVNNYRVMMLIRELLAEPDIKLTPTLVKALHETVTDGTLAGEDEGKGGVLRTAADNIVVGDPVSGDTLHVPPKAQELEERLQRICDFVNGELDEEDSYMPPVLRAIITHFMVGYDHPFVEGNGRTARALFYWVMMKSNYWLMEYVSISAVIKKSQGEYLKAYLHTETDDNDLTYFILQQLQVIKKAISDFQEHVKRKATRDLEVLELFKCSKLRTELNTRQVALIRNALKNPGNVYTAISHATSHKCSREMARRDLLKLSDDHDLLDKYKKGRVFVFVSPADLADRIESAS